MRVVYPDQIREMDRKCREEHGIPTLQLMEAAGKSVFTETCRYLAAHRQEKKVHKVICVCGKGNNGGDGLVAARYWLQDGAEVVIFVLAPYEAFSPGDALENYHILKLNQGDIRHITKDNLQDLEAELQKADIIVDAMLGVGIQANLEGIYAKAAELINAASQALVVAVDIPSGIDGERGCVLGSAVQADLTVAIAAAKAGNLLYPGKAYCGTLQVCDIGVPEAVMDSLDIRCCQTEASLVQSCFPKRVADTNKGSYGRIGIISGSSGMTGAGILAGKAAMRTGAGLVYHIIPREYLCIYEQASLETVTLPVETGASCFTGAGVEAVLEACRPLDVIVAGPGLGTKDATEQFLDRFLTGLRDRKELAGKWLVLDADALNILSGRRELLKSLPQTCILTPHPGEMSRLCGRSIPEIQSNRIDTARMFAAEYGKIVVLKGAATVTALPNDTVFLNPTGNPGMATAGSGDVLCGVIAAVSAMGCGEAAAPCGVYLHGLAGDLAAMQYGEYSLVAGDVIEKIPAALQHILQQYRGG